MWDQHPPAYFIYIYEANILRELVIKGVDGQKVLKALLNWFVLMTKEYRKFQVVVIVSCIVGQAILWEMIDSMQLLLGIYLSKEGARFFGTELLTKVFVVERHYLLMQYMMYVVVVCFYCTKCTKTVYTIGGIHPTESFYLYQARMKLMKSLEPNNTFYHDPLKSPPK